MTVRRSTLERAFEIARSVEWNGLTALMRQLHAEGYTDARVQCDGPAIRRQLKKAAKTWAVANHMTRALKSRARPSTPPASFETSGE